MRAQPKTYDRAYFERWYHHPTKRVITPSSVARKVRLAVSITEMLLERPVRSVLDIGCGEGAWRAHLRRERPRVRYTGVESSAYAVGRYGRSRNILHGTFGALDGVRLRGPYDLIVVCDVLQYIPDAELSLGLRSIASLLGGVAFLEAYAAEDAVDGDRAGWHERSSAEYRRRIRAAGLQSVGMHCYVGEALRDRTAALERG